MVFDLLKSRRTGGSSPLESPSARQRAVEIWQRLAALPGSYALKDDGPRDLPTLLLRHDGVDIELSLSRNLHHRTARWQTSVSAGYPLPVGPRFVVAAAHPAAALPDELVASPLPAALCADDGDSELFCVDLTEADDALRVLAPVFADLRALWSRALRIEGERSGVRVYVAGYLDSQADLDRAIAAVASMGSGEQLLGLAALRALPGIYREGSERRCGAAVVVVRRGIVVEVGRRTRPRLEPWPSTVARTSWGGTEDYLRVAICEGKATPSPTVLALHHYPHLLAVLGRCELRLDRTRLQLAWPRIVDDVAVLEAGVELLARVAAASGVALQQGVYR